MQGHLLAIREATFPGFRLGPFPAAGEEVRCRLDSDNQERSVNQRGSERSHFVQLSRHDLDSALFNSDAVTHERLLRG